MSAEAREEKVRAEERAREKATQGEETKGHKVARSFLEVPAPTGRRASHLLMSTVCWGQSRPASDS